MEEPELGDGELASRFIYESSKISKSTRKPQPGAFMPMYEKELKRLETSVCHSNGCTEERVWTIARLSQPDRPLKARVDFHVLVVTSARLKCVSSPIEPGYEEHAVIIAWPDSKEEQKAMAVAIAKACPEVIDPPTLQ